MAHALSGMHRSCVSLHAVPGNRRIAPTAFSCARIRRAGILVAATTPFTKGGDPMLLTGMIALGLVTFAGLYAFIGFCDRV
jgi:hypothetical protein